MSMSKTKPISVCVGALELPKKRHSLYVKVSNLIGYKPEFVRDIFREEILGGPEDISIP